MASMDPLYGIEVIEALQSALSPTLDLVFILFTLLGEDYVYMSLLAITYWCFNKKTGVELSYVLLASAYLNYWMKMSFGMDKPPSEYRIILKDDISYGFPSGHAQGAVTFWGWAGKKIGKAWGHILFFTLIFFIDLSRIYLGVHYLGDVLSGILFGGVFLIIAYKSMPYLERKLSRIPRLLRDYLLPLVSVLLFGLSSTVFPDVARGNSALICGNLFGFSLGVPLESKCIDSPMAISRRTKAIRAGVGLITVFGLYLVMSFLLDALSLDTLVYIQFLKYAIVAFTIAFIEPLIFRYIQK